MHYTGTIWRPPYEAESLLLEVTAGCTHHKCKFCTLYNDLSFQFRMSPLEDIENDLLEAQILCSNPISRRLCEKISVKRSTAIKTILWSSRKFAAHIFLQYTMDPAKCQDSL